ncbi:MAG TPA: globin domain-containing protein [Polyangiaceae bacterium]|nr:globin domain-containing protein [Polyangiaceae bacterium]
MKDLAKILRETLEITLAADDSFPKRFYDRLFSDHPEVIPMFHRNSPGAQRKLFAQKLAMIVDHVADPEWLDRELGKVAASHRSYGVTPEMYAWVGDALIETIGEACGAEWSDAAERAWKEAYAKIATAVIAKG